MQPNQPQSNQSFDEPDATTGVRINPRDIIGHLLLVWPVDYIAHSPTIHTRADRPSDVIVVDCVDLDAADENGAPGLLARRVWWRQSKLIQALKSKVGAQRPILVRMMLGTAAKGFQAPFELQSASSDPNAVQRAQAWLAAHPDFDPKDFNTTAPAPESQYQPGFEPRDPWQPEQRQESMLEQMARTARETQSGGGSQPLHNPHSVNPPPPPRAPYQYPDQPGF